MHPFARTRERTRALNAAKMDRIFAKPFVASLEGHVDAIECLIKQPGSLRTVASGSWDGGGLVLQFHSINPGTKIIWCYLGLIVHDLPERRHAFHAPQAHKGKVSGLTFASGNRVLSCGVDKNVKLWDVGNGADNQVGLFQST